MKNKQHKNLFLIPLTKETSLILSKHVNLSICDFDIQIKIKMITKMLCYKQVWSSTCALTSFFWLLGHVIYLKLTRVECLLYHFTKFQFLNNKIYSYTKKTYLALANLILSFKNLQDWKVNSLLSFSGGRLNLRKLKAFILQKIQAWQKKKLYYPSLSLGKRTPL